MAGPFGDPRLAEHLFRNLMDHITDGVYFKDTQSRFIWVSARLAKMFRVDDPGKVVGRTDFDFFTEEHARQAFNDEQEILRTGTPVVAKEEKETWPDGRVTWASSTKLPLRDDRGTIIGTFGISRDITQRKLMEEALVRSEAELREHHNAVQRELRQAWEMLRALLPDAPPTHPRLEAYLHIQPMEAIGGDYISFPTLPDGAPAVFLADLMGHGISAALYMALVKFFSDGLVAEHGRDPQAFLEQLNRQVRARMPSTFVSGAYGRFEFSPGAAFSIAGAGHPAPLIVRARTRKAELLKLGGNAALGITDQFKTHAVRAELEPGDRLFLFTDGLQEAFNRQDEWLGLDRLVELFSASRGRNVREVILDVLAGVETFRDGAPVSDDIVLVGFEVRQNPRT